MIQLEAWLDGQPISELADVHLLDVAETPVLLSEDTPLSPGALPIPTRLQVMLTIALRNPDPAQRMYSLASLLRWCRGRTLALSCRPGQQLTVICAEPPAPGSALRWTEEMSLSFIAPVPFWRDQQPVTHAFAMASAVQEATLTLPGTAPDAPLALTITPAAPLNHLTIRWGSHTMALHGLSLAAGDTLALGEDDMGRFYLRNGAQSLLHCRTMTSPDTLSIPLCTATPVRMEGDAPFSGRIEGYGRYH